MNIFLSERELAMWGASMDDWDRAFRNWRIRRRLLYVLIPIVGLVCAAVVLWIAG
jgi:hypothetical protein